MIWVILLAAYAYSLRWELFFNVFVCAVVFAQAFLLTLTITGSLLGKRPQQFCPARSLEDLYIFLFSISAGTFFSLLAHLFWDGLLQNV